MNTDQNTNKFKEPLLVKAGSNLLKLGVLGVPPKADCRVIAEEQYQVLMTIKGSMQAISDSPIGEVIHERSRQNNKWGEQNHNMIEWIGVLSEEVGEAAKEAVDFHFANGVLDPKTKPDEKIQSQRIDDYRKEMIQVAAVAIQAVESLDRQTQRELKPFVPRGESPIINALKSVQDFLNSGK